MQDHLSELLSSKFFQLRLLYSVKLYAHLSPSPVHADSRRSHPGILSSLPATRELNPYLGLISFSLFVFQTGCFLVRQPIP